MIDEQKFWEKCGWRIRANLPSLTYKGDLIWEAPVTDKAGQPIYTAGLPLIHDLNALFKWAVPVLQRKGLIINLVAYEHEGFRCDIAYFLADEQFIVVQGNAPALALAEAIYKALEGK